MNDSDKGGVVFAPRVLDCIVCRHFGPVWRADGNTGDEEIVDYCDLEGFGDKDGFAKPTKRIVCHKFEMTNGYIKTALGNFWFNMEEDL